MPRLLLCLLAIAGSAAIALATDITIVVDFDGPHSARSIQQMKRETEEIVKGSGLRLEWRSRGDVGSDNFANLVVVSFKGKCALEPEPVRTAIHGPFAFTYNSNGQVLPFSEVSCDHVAASVRPAMWGDDFARLDYLMGRALGRVVAHELVHIFTKSGSHGREGIAQAALSGGELIGAPLRLSRGDMERLRCGLAGQ